jgi:hypothetical protein
MRISAPISRPDPFTGRTPSAGPAPDAGDSLVDLVASGEDGALAVTVALGGVAVADDIAPVVLAAVDGLVIGAAPTGELGPFAALSRTMAPNSSPTKIAPAPMATKALRLGSRR